MNQIFLIIRNNVLFTTQNVNKESYYNELRIPLFFKSAESIIQKYRLGDGMSWRLTFAY